MDAIELDNFGEDGREEDAREEEEREEEDTSFTENTNNANAEFDNIRDLINQPQEGDTTRVDLNNLNPTDLERQIQDHAARKAIQRYDSIQALETATDTRFSVTHGESSKELIDNISDAKYNEKGELTALKFKEEDFKLTAKGEIDKRYKQNKGILKAIEKAKDEYNKSLASVIDEPISDESISSVQGNINEELEGFIDDKYNKISQSDPDKNIEREVNRISRVDDNVDYDDLGDPNQKAQYEAKIAGLRKNIKYWEDLEQKEQDPTRKLLYKTAKELCITKKSQMEIKAGFRPESEEALSMVQEEARTNDLTRYERFKKWAKENIAGVSTKT